MAVAREQAHDGETGRTLSAARFPDHTEAFPLLDLERDVVDGHHRSMAEVELGAKSVYLEHWGHRPKLLRLGSKPRLGDPCPPAGAAVAETPPAGVTRAGPGWGPGQLRRSGRPATGRSPRCTPPP